jgi:hypothetical protein
MKHITISIPDDVFIQMKHFPEIRWSEVARKAIVEHLEMLKLAEKLSQKSKLSEYEVKEFNKKIKSSATKRFLN